MASRPQKGKNRKRPRAWHRGQAAGRIQALDLAAIERAETRAEMADAELEPIRARGREETELWRALEHVAPFVPSWR